MKITIIAGARPNFMKIAPLARAIKAEQAQGKDIQYRLVYTGSRQDASLDSTLFEDLGMDAPDVYLNVEATDFFERLAGILVSFAHDLDAHPTDLVMVVDDMTPTMACSIVAKKKGIKVAHLVAGIRSFDMNMPKEVNRMITDGLSDYFFTAGMNSNRNLNQTGTEQAHVYFVGNLLIDTLRYNRQRFVRPDMPADITDGAYLLFTLNRRAVVDEPETLENLLETLLRETDLPIMAPLHTYVADKIRSLHLDLSRLHLLPPQPYLQFGYLEAHAAGIITDSGNVAEEATFLGIPCITLHDYVEHPETVNQGTNVAVGLDMKELAEALRVLRRGEWKTGSLPERWDGRTAERILQILEEIKF
ncbi:UDP-N-acetyl glucosamine 2-epimerase [Bacteroides sp. Marseille-P3684]|uniref:UDP-N-acetyl glucosamine 2-epimerase n=1 Tax=Bacteroides sp. Marseille-P3684 TaxID=2086579 RepID=UPI000D0B959C|nr:UDP-N-acetyl glucosamine 2-epimerase [Bacteroides sp. Marseille-P3684]